MLYNKTTLIKRIMSVVLAGVTIISFSGCKNSIIGAQEAKASEVKSVTCFETKNEPYYVSANYKGYVAAKEVKNLSFEVPGKIQAIYVDNGQKINKGDILADLDTTNTKMGVDNANQNILLAKNSINQIEDGISKLDSGLEAEKLNLAKIETGLEAEELSLKKIQDSYDSAITKIMISYDYIKDTYDKTATLYEAGVASKKDYDDAKYAFESIDKELKTTEQNRDNDISLQLKNIENMKKNIELQKVAITALEKDKASAYTQIQASNIQVNQANIGLEQYNKQMNDSTLVSPIDGYVAAVPVNSGEIVAAGYPVVVVKSENQVVNIGVAAEDYNKIKTGMTVTVKSPADTFSGTVSTISQYPDEGTRTYNVEIIPEKTDLVAATILDVEIPIENKEGIFVPIQSVINIDGVSYVYCVQTDEATGNKISVKKEVTLGEVRSEHVLAENLTPGMLVIGEGVKNLRENDIVVIN